MRLEVNRNAPTVLYCDMNSSFASIEQQAHFLDRGKPLGVAKYTNPNGPVIGPSKEAKLYGIKTAHNVRNCRLLCPEIIIRQSDPAKYREAHRRFCRLFRSYSPDVLPKSIDEVVIDFEHTPALKHRSIVDIAREIKARIKDEIGEALTVNVGIGTNTFLAKTAASFNKPDALEVIDHTNLREALTKLDLTDLCGIESRYASRLNASGIYTPLQFLDADPRLLARQVFHSVEGYYWHMDLRGWRKAALKGPERRTYGNSYSIRKPSAKEEENLKLLCKLCEMCSRRMRRDAYSCRTVTVMLKYVDETHFLQRRTVDAPLYATSEVFLSATRAFKRQGSAKTITKMAVRLSSLEPGASEQLDLFESVHTKQRRVSDTVDALNDRYGDYRVYWGQMHGLDDQMIDSISFDSTGDVEQLYDEEEALVSMDDQGDGAFFAEPNQ